MGIRCTLRKSTQSLRFSDSIPDCGNDLATVFIIHKRELSDSMIESGSSLFYLFHCSAHDRLNTMPFRLFRNTPHGLHRWRDKPPENTARLCLSTPRTDCITRHGGKTSFHQLCLSTPRTDCICVRREEQEETLTFASAHPVRIASAKSHRCNATNPRNML